jgi:hypothetical protein
MGLPNNVPVSTAKLAVHVCGDDRLTDINQKGGIEAVDGCGRLVGAAGPCLKFKGILEFLPKFGADDISHCLSGQTSYGSRLSILAF